MKTRSYTAAALCAAILLSSCGAIGSSSPELITKKTGGDTAPAETTVSTTKETTNAAVNTDSSTDLQSEEPAPEAPVFDLSGSADDIISQMSVEQKIGQLFIIRPDALETAYDDSTVNDDTLGGVTYLDGMMKEAMAKYNVGGVVLYDKNIVEPEQLKKLTADLQAQSSVPMFIATDEEGGDYTRIAANKNFDVPLLGNALDIGLTKDPDNAAAAAETIGNYLSEYGVNTNLAPCGDTSYFDPDFTRNFSANAYEVAEMVTAEIESYHENNIICAVGHFPGSEEYEEPLDEYHVNLANWAAISEWDVAPFAKNLDNADMIMVGHTVTPNVGSGTLPASLSEDMITGKLRTELKYDGVVMTSVMADKAVRDNYTDGEAAVEAIKAGADIILAPYSFEGAYEGLLKAVQEGVITEERIDQSLKRILELKKAYGLF